MESRAPRVLYLPYVFSKQFLKHPLDSILKSYQDTLSTPKDLCDCANAILAPYVPGAPPPHPVAALLRAKYLPGYWVDLAYAMYFQAAKSSDPMLKDYTFYAQHKVNLYFNQWIQIENKLREIFIFHHLLDRKSHSIDLEKIPVGYLLDTINQCQDKVSLALYLEFTIIVLNELEKLVYANLTMGKRRTLEDIVIKKVLIDFNNDLKGRLADFKMPPSEAKGAFEADTDLQSESEETDEDAEEKERILRAKIEEEKRRIVHNSLKQAAYEKKVEKNSRKTFWQANKVQAPVKSESKASETSTVNTGSIQKFFYKKDTPHERILSFEVPQKIITPKNMFVLAIQMFEIGWQDSLKICFPPFKSEIELIDFIAKIFESIEIVENAQYQCYIDWAKYYRSDVKSFMVSLLSAIHHFPLLKDKIKKLMWENDDLNKLIFNLSLAKMSRDKEEIERVASNITTFMEAMVANCHPKRALAS